MLLYRGFNNNYPNMGVRPNQKGIWMTDDEEYANEYSKLFKNGAIAEIDIDDNANIANVYDCREVFKDEEDIEEYLYDLGDDLEFDNQVCDKLLEAGYDGLFFDDYGKDCYYIFNSKVIKGYKIIKIFQNDREDAMESLCEGLGYKETIIAYRGIELPPNSEELNRREYLNFFNNYNGEYYFKEGTPQWFSCYSCISITYGSWVVKAKLQLNNICDLTDKKVLHAVLPNFFNKIKKEILQYYKGEELERQLSIIDKCSFDYIKDDIYLNWKDVIDEVKKQGYDSIKSLEDSEDLMYIDKGYIIWSMNNIIDYKVLYYDYRSEKYYTIEQYKEGMDSNGSFWSERLDSEGIDDYNEYAMESTINNILKNAGVKPLNEAIFFNDEVYNDWNDQYEQLKVLLNPSIDWLRNELNKPHCWGFRFLHNTQDNLLYVWSCEHSFTHEQVFEMVDMKWGKDGTNVVGVFDPKSVLVWEALSPDGYEEESIKLAKKLDGKLFDELYPDGYKIGICY